MNKTLVAEILVPSKSYKKLSQVTQPYRDSILVSEYAGPAEGSDGEEL